LDDTQATTSFASAARVLPEGALHDEQGRLGFTGFDRRVVRVTIVDADGGVHAVFAQLRSPAAASEPGTTVCSRQYATGLRVDIVVSAAGSEVGVVPGDDMATTTSLITAAVNASTAVVVWVARMASYLSRYKPYASQLCSICVLV
jgi:hypothetical protein